MSFSFRVNVHVNGTFFLASSFVFVGDAFEVLFKYCMNCVKSTWVSFGPVLLPTRYLQIKLFYNVICNVNPYSGFTNLYLKCFIICPKSVKGYFFSPTLLVQHQSHVSFP